MSGAKHFEELSEQVQPGAAVAFTVIISGFKETARDTLSACLALTAVRTGSVEVLLIDNTSEGRLKASFESLMRTPVRPGFSARYVPVPVPGKAAAQNAAIRLSRGLYVVCLDDDVLPAPDMLCEYEQAFTLYPTCVAVQGRVELLFEGIESPPRWLTSRLRLDLAEMDFGRIIYPFEMGLTGANMAFRRGVFDTYGLFDERLGPGRTGTLEDQEFSERIRAKGDTQLFWPGASVRHRIPPQRLRISSLMKTYYIVGFSDYLLWRKNTRRGPVRFGFYILRQIARCMAAAAVAGLRGRTDVAVHEFCELARFWGYYRQFLRSRPK